MWNPRPVAFLIPLAFVACATPGGPPAPRVVAPDGRPSDWATLLARAGAARFVLLGEVHDNPHHHRLQARVIEALAGGPEPPAVVFEMLELDDQPVLDAFDAQAHRDPDDLAARVGWAQSGWPPFALYRPVFAAALDADLPILAAGIPRARRMAGDLPAPDPRFGVDEPLPPEEMAARLDEMFASHCELMPRETLAPMVAMQRARDAALASGLLAGAERAGRAVLVAGGGHARRGAVPDLLARAGVPRDAILAVGFLEGEPAADDAARFDLAVFTPAAEREDPCEALRLRLE